VFNDKKEELSRSEGNGFAMIFLIFQFILLSKENDHSSEKVTPQPKQA